MNDFDISELIEVWELSLNFYYCSWCEGLANNQA